METENLSDFQKKKIIHVFTLLYDKNKDGDITKKDFDESHKSICELLKWTKGSKEHEMAHSTLVGIWEGLKGKADKDKDGKVSQNEWLNMWRDCIKDMKKGNEFPDWQKNFIDFMFKVNDASGDGKIDLNEYTTVYGSYKVSKDDCEKAFKEIAGGLDSTITREAFDKLWYDYFVMDDPSSKANYLFGVPDFLKK